MADKNELLEILLLKEFWDTSDACDFFVGHKVRLGRGYGEAKIQNLITGKELVGNSAKRVIERWTAIREIWEASPHGQNTVEGNYVTGDWMYPRNYCINWGQRKQTSSGGLWEGFRECLKVGLEEPKWIKAIDLASEDETPTVKNIAENSKKAEAKEIAKDTYKKARSTSGTPASDKELENRLRLVGTMLDILVKKDVKQKFSSANDVIAHIDQHYKGHGLSERKLKDIFAKAKILVEKKSKN